MFRERVPGVGSGDRKSSAADGSQYDWRHDQTVSSGRAQTRVYHIKQWHEILSATTSPDVQGRVVHKSVVT